MTRAERLAYRLLEAGGPSKGRLGAFGGNLPPAGLYADGGEDELLGKMRQGGYLQGDDKEARSELYKQHSVLHAKNPEDVSVYGKPKLNLDKKTGDAALARLGVDPEKTKEVQSVPGEGANRSAMPLEKAVYAGKDAEAVKGAAQEMGKKLGVYIGLNQGRTTRGNMGVTVGAVVPGSPLAQAGLEPGDIISEIGGARVRSQGVLKALVGGMEAGKPYTLRVRRGRLEYRTTLVPTESQ